MGKVPLHALTLTEAAAGIAAGKFSARALADAQLARIAATDATIEAWAHLDPAEVRAAAKRCDAAPTERSDPVRTERSDPVRTERSDPGRTERSDPVRITRRGPLHGIGVGVKDIIATTDQPTEMGTPLYAGHRPKADAACVARLKRAGGFVFGKTVTTEFAYFHPGKTKNPWNPRHTPGGSSSGSAAAVAAGHVAGAIGTQTNGSVIRPAAYCGVVGFKPTLGAIPPAGVHVFSETLDQIGTFTRNVADAARLASVLAEPAAIASIPAVLAKAPRLAYLGDFPWTELDCDDDDEREAAATRLRLEADIVQVDFPGEWREANRLHRTIMFYECARNLAPLQDRERARLSAQLNAAIDDGRRITRADYDASVEARRRAIAFFTRSLDGYDAILAPSAPSAAPAGLTSTGDPSCCTLWSLLGFPAISLPVGLNTDKLPIGLQIASPAGSDDRLLAVAAWAEARLPFKGLV